MNGQRRGPWTIRATREIYDNPWIRLREHDVLNPAGNPGLYGVIEVKNLALGVIAIDDRGQTILVGQHRFPHDAYSWEIPEGGGPLDVDPVASAARELAEETGLTARRYAEILRMDLSNAVSDETALVYLVWDLIEGAPQPEETEQLTTRWLDFDAALALVNSGTIRDAISIAAILKVEYLRNAIGLDLKRIEDFADRLEAKHMPAMPQRIK